MTEMNTTPRGPFETAAQAAAAAGPIREAVRQADPGHGAMTDQVRAARAAARIAHVTDTLTAAGVELGAYDRRMIQWIAVTWDHEETAVILDWVLRARTEMLAELPVYDSIDAMVQALDGPITKRARYSWVLYKPQAGHGGILEAAGSEGTAVGLVDPVELAADMLAKHAADAPESVVKVFGADDRLVAWAQFEDGETVAYLPKGGGKR